MSNSRFYMTVGKSGKKREIGFKVATNVYFLSLGNQPVRFVINQMINFQFQM